MLHPPSRGHGLFLSEHLERRVLLSTVVKFAAELTSAVGIGPLRAVTADLNGDGKPDVVSSNYYSGSVTVLLSNGNGTFAPSRSFAVGTGAYGLAIADLNGDGKSDLAVVNSFNGTVSILLGNGNGTFLPQQTYAVGSHPHDVVIGDFNDDGKADLIVSNNGSGTVSQLLGNGNGTFRAQTTLAVGASPGPLASGKLVSTSKFTDVVVGNLTTGAVGILLANGNGTFQALHTAAVGSNPQDIVLADFNDDGKLDLAVANDSNTANSVSVLLGTGTGTFGARATFAVGTSPPYLVATDINGDGKLDLAVANYTNGNVGVLLGNGNGTFLSQQTVATTVHPGFLVATDMDGDGTPDLVSVHYSADRVGVLLNRSNPPRVLLIAFASPGPTTSASSVSFTVQFTKGVTGVDPTDFVVPVTGNVTYTNISIVVVSSAIYTVTVSGISGAGTLGLNLVDNGSIRDLGGQQLAGGYVTFQPAFTVASGPYPTSLSSADLNGDGKPDLVVSNFYERTVSILLSNGNGTFQPRRTYAVGPYPENSYLVDVNGDGKPDIIVVNKGLYYESPPQQSVPGSISVLLGNGNGTFQPQVQYLVGTNPIEVAVADVNGDGKPDIFTRCLYPFGNQTYDVNFILFGNGNGTFSPTSHGTHYINSVAADVNGDGKADLVSEYGVGSSPGTWGGQILLGLGNGLFYSSASVNFGQSTDAPPFYTGDVNGDGRVDVVAVASPTGSAVTLLGNGNGTFQAGVTSATGSGFAVALADMNGDGNLDLVMAGEGVAVGNGDGTFKIPQNTYLPAGGVAIADFTGDGRPDYAVSNELGGTVTIFPNGFDGGFVGQKYTIVFPAFVTSINRWSPSTQITASTSLTYTVTFNTSVTNLQASDFQVVTTGSVAASNQLVVAGSGNDYTVTINGVHGSGTLQLELIDHDTVLDLFGTPLGGVGVSNGSFIGQSYTILQTFPTILSINRTNPPTPTSVDNAVAFTVTFNEPVTGVAASDFSLALSGVAVSNPLSVSGSGAVYTVTASGISGIGTLGLNFIDNGTVKDLAGNPLQNGGGGPVSFQSPKTFSAGMAITFVTSADVNGDGRPDLIGSYLHGTAVSVLLGNGNGTFAPPQTSFAQNPVYGLVVCDLNGDGIPDIVAINNTGMGVATVLLGDGSGGFHLFAFIPIAKYPSSIAAADLNGDGKADLAITSSEGLSLLLGNGDGTFRPQETFAFDGLGSVAVSDVNGDGKPDIVLANKTFSYAGVLLGNGDGTFALPLTSGSLLGPQSLAVSDVNGDGVPDLIVDNPVAMGVMLGNGNGTFGATTTFSTSRSPYFTVPGMVVADVNGDGKVDAVVDNYYPGNISLLLGNGNGTFESRQPLATGTDPIWPTAADFDSDGRLDFVTAGSVTGTVTLLDSNTPQNFTGQSYIIVPPADTITGSSNADAITLTRDTDGTDIDWSIFSSSGSSSGVLPINDPNGLTINGNGGNDTIVLSYTNGNPLPNILHLNSGTGEFIINALQGTNPLANTTLDIGRSTVFLGYSGGDPIAAIKSYLQAGYNHGAWSGVPTASTGVITSSAAASNHTSGKNNTGVGYADSTDGQGINTIANTIELTYTLYGDANLDHQVNSADLQRFLNFFNTPATWDQGDFNYDGVNNSADQQLVLFDFNTQLGSQATPLAISATATYTAPTIAAQTPPARNKTPVQSPAVSASTLGSASHPAAPALRRVVRHRRR